MMKRISHLWPAAGLFLLTACTGDVVTSEFACVETFLFGDVQRVAQIRTERFLGKVPETRARCLGGQYAVDHRNGPWLDWPNYWATRGPSSRVPLRLLSDAKFIGPNAHGINAALYELELQRIELIKFNLFDNNKTYEAYVKGRDGDPGPILQTWPEMRLPPSHPNFQDVGGTASQQICTGETIRFRTLTGICNDLFNPLMGSTGQLFARNTQFDTTFPELGLTDLTKIDMAIDWDCSSPIPKSLAGSCFPGARRILNPVGMDTATAVHKPVVTTRRRLSSMCWPPFGFNS